MHDDVVDDVGKRALQAMKQFAPELFMTGTAKVKYSKSAFNLDGTGVGFFRGTKTSRIKPRINSPSMSEA